MSAVSIDQCAQELFQQRQARARQEVAEGRVGVERATQALRPWLAIACLAGAELPELATGLAAPWMVTVFPRVAPAFHREMDEPAMRTLLAEEICPRQRWAPLLAQARDRALDAAADSGVVEIARHAGALQDLCRQLGVTIPYMPRPADTLRKDIAA